MEEEAVALTGVEVHGHREAVQTTTAVSTLYGEALLQSRGESYESMRKRAAQIGADAIIITNLGGYASLTTTWAGDDPYSHYYSRLVGTVIKYK